MRRCVRPPEPAVLRENAVRWTLAFAPGGAEFRWHRVENRPLNEHLLGPLREMTASHCAYCDGFPLDVQALSTIDHFKPKSKFRDLAFAWQNLYLVCSACNFWKRDHWDEATLRPDDVGFDFLRYFIFDFASGRIEPNPRSDSDSQRRAQATIELLGLNREGRPADRRRTLERQRTPPLSDGDRDDRAYRFLWELGG